jgi:hypothetical protein
MNAKVHPLVVALVLFFTIIAIAIWTWGTGEAASIGGPAELRTDRDGHLYIQIQNQLVEHDTNGAFLKTHDLTGLGVELFLGTYGFFSNGDILMRRGPDPRGFVDNFRAYLRQATEQSLTPLTPESGLFRCNLDTATCTRFGVTGVDFKAAHGIFIDRQTDDVYISDTTRHGLRKYADDGTELAGPVTGFRFPNQLLLHNDQLLVADTNHHQIRIVDPRTARFGADIDKVDVVPGAARDARQTWPSHFARVGSEWWVNNMRSGMNEGGIYIFDENWRYDRKVSLPPGADPISLIAYRGEVLVSDWNNDRVRRLSVAGEQLPDFESAGLEKILVDSRATRDRFELIAYSGVAALVLVFVSILVRAFTASTSLQAPQRVAAETAEKARRSDVPLLLEPNPATIRKITRAVRLATILVIGGSIILGYFIATLRNGGFGAKLILPFSAQFAIIFLMNWVSRANVGTAIRLHDGRITLRDHSGRESTSHLKDVRYNETAIATHDIAIFLGRAKASVYDQRALEEELFPLLENAQKVPAFKMQQILIQLRHPQGIITVLAVVGLVAYAVWKLVGLNQ